MIPRVRAVRGSIIQLGPRDQPHPIRPSFQADQSSSSSVGSGQVTGTPGPGLMGQFLYKAGYVPKTELATVSSELASLQSSIATAQAQNSVLTTKVGSLTTSVASAQSQNASLKSQVTLLTGQISSVQASIASLQGKISNVNATISSYISSINQTKASIGSFESQISQAKANLASLTTQYNGIQSTIASLTSQLSGLKSQISTLQGNVSNATSQVGSLQTKYGNLQTQLQSLQSQVGSLQTQISNYIGNITGIATPSPGGTRSDAYTDSVSAMPGGVPTSGFGTLPFESKPSDVPTGPGASFAYAPGTLGFTAGYKGLVNSGGQFFMQASPGITHILSGSTGGGPGSRLAGALGYIPISSLSTPETEVASYQSQLSNLQSQNSALSAQATTLGNQLGTLQSSNAALSSQVASLQSSLSTYTSQDASLSGQLSTLTSQLGQLTGQLSNLNSQYSTLQGQAASLTSQVDTLQSEISSGNNSISSLRGQISSSNSAISSLQTKYTALQAEISTLTSGIAHYVGLVSSVMTQVGLLQGQLAAWKKGGFPVSFSWNFGDGTTSTAENPTHAYNGLGTFDISLTITVQAPNQTYTHTFPITRLIMGQWPSKMVISGGGATGFGTITVGVFDPFGNLITDTRLMYRTVDALGFPVEKPTLATPVGNGTFQFPYAGAGTAYFRCLRNPLIHGSSPMSIL